MLFVMIWIILVFLGRECTCKSKICIVMQPLQNAPFCSSTVLVCIANVILTCSPWMAVWLSGSLMKYCLGGRVDTANRVRGSRLSTTNNSMVTAGPQQLLHTTTVNSWRSLHELRQQQHPLHSRQLPSIAAFLMSFGNNNSLFTGCSIATAGFLQHCHGSQQLIHSCFTAILLLLRCCYTSLTTASSQQDPTRHEQHLHSSPLTAM